MVVHTTYRSVVVTIKPHHRDAHRTLLSRDFSMLDNVASVGIGRLVQRSAQGEGEGEGKLSQLFSQL